MKSWMVVGVLLIGALVAWLVYRSMSAEVVVEAAGVQVGPISQFIDEQGKTRLPVTHLITMPYDGRVEAIDLVEGVPVKKDQVVARVVKLDLELSVDEATAAVDRLEAAIRQNDDTTVEKTGLEQSLRYVESMDTTVRAAATRVKAGEAKLDFASKHLARIKELRPSNAATEQELNLAELAYVEADVDYQQDKLVLSALESLQAATALLPTVVQQYTDRKQLARAVLEKEKVQAETRLRDEVNNQQLGTMISPVDAVVLERLESNERLVPGGTVLLKIGRLEELQVEADILSQDVVDVKVGDRVDIYGPAIDKVDCRGTVSRIYPAGFTKVSSLGVEQQRVRVIIEFADGELARLRSEQDLGVDYRVRVRIYTAEKDEALVIPRSALFRGPADDWQVFVVRQGKARLQTVPVGLLNDRLAEVTAVLTADDMVILAPETSLTDGTPVRAVLPAQPPAKSPEGS